MESPNVSDVNKKSIKKDDTHFPVHIGMGHFSNIFPYLSQFMAFGGYNQEDSILIHPITVETSYNRVNIAFNEETSTDRHDWLKRWDNHNTDQNIEDIVIYI